MKFIVLLIHFIFTTKCTQTSYLQFDALWPVHYLQIKNLTKVNPEIHVEVSTVCSRNFFIIVEDLNEEGTLGHLLSTSKFTTTWDKNKTYQTLLFLKNTENLWLPGHCFMAANVV